MIPLKAFATLSLVVLLAMPSVAAEGPNSYDCEGPNGYFVCAGAEAGGNVECNASPSPAGECTFTYGWIFDAFSYIGLPGDATYSWNGTIEFCISGPSTAPCVMEPLESGDADCSWLVDGDCVVSVAGEGGSYGPVDLVPGDCLTVTVRLEAYAFGSVPSGAPIELASVDDTGSGEDGGQVCNYDDGRAV